MATSSIWTRGTSLLPSMRSNAGSTRRTRRPTSRRLPGRSAFTTRPAGPAYGSTDTSTADVIPPYYDSLIGKPRCGRLGIVVRQRLEFFWRELQTPEHFRKPSLQFLLLLGVRRSIPCRESLD